MTAGSASGGSKAWMGVGEIGERVVRLGKEPGRHVAVLEFIAYCGGLGS
jgi:hypothetical protein